MSLAIRIRPFFDNPANDIREAAILLFGDLCQLKITSNGTAGMSPTFVHNDDVDVSQSSADEPTTVSDALREQLFSNFFSMLLHLSETDRHIVRVSFSVLHIKIVNFINY